REALAARRYSGDIDHRPPIGCDVGGPVRRVRILGTASRPSRYRRNRCRAIAVLFSWTLGLMPRHGAIIFGDLTGKLAALRVVCDKYDRTSLSLQRKQAKPFVSR